jgi:hypothetical protein
MPHIDVIRAHVFAAERIHADDITVPVLGKTRAGKRERKDCVKLSSLDSKLGEAISAHLA